MKRALLKLLLLVFAASWLYLIRPDFINDFDNRLIDYRFASRGTVASDERIIIVGIDQNSISSLNRPYFAFAQEFARAAEKALDAKAAGLLFDLVLPPSSEKAIKEHVASVAAQIGLELPHRFFRQLGFDQALRSSMLKMKASSTNLIIGFAYEKNQEFLADRAILRIARAESTGFFNLPVDRDGRIRRTLLRARSGDEHTRSVAALGAMALSSDTVLLDVDDYRTINFRGPAKTFKTIPLSEFLETPESSLGQFRDRLLLLGFTDITDTKSTPFGYMPGVEIHANIVDNILNRRFLEPLSNNTEVLILLILLLTIFAIARMNKILSALLAVIAALLWLAFSFKAADSMVVPVFRPLFMLFLIAITELYSFVRRMYLDRRRIRTIFSRYVSDSVLHEVLTASDQDFLSGRRRRLCILIADIRGFTTFSEKKEATEVVEFLNQYFARITEIIMNNGGVVDKFLGDGLLAFFNAPVEHPDFADQAIKSSIEICKFAESQEFAHFSGNFGLKVGIALNIGSVVFGNIGSEKKAEFTVIGDAVNACSRMESLNKEFGTSILVSEDVVKESKSGVEWKLLGRRALRGKSEEISLYTLI